jgi:hypothetical protein
VQGAEMARDFVAGVRGAARWKFRLLANFRVLDSFHSNTTSCGFVNLATTSSFTIETISNTWRNERLNLESIYV